MDNNRELFSNKMGFILAAAGSAVGLGNIWRFPYLAAKYGGGAFILTYVLLVFTVGFTLLMTEITLGRKTQLSSVGAYTKLNKKWGFVGVIAVIVSMIVVPYYSVIGGWIIKYFTVLIFGNIETTIDSNFFTNFISKDVEPIFWLSVFILISALILLGGVKNGIEKANKILMPILIVLSVVLVCYSFTLEGVGEGFKYLLVPDFSKFSIMGFVAALGQMFFSMSIGMSVMITYGSYMGKKDDIEDSVKHIGFFDTGIAILASMMIVPAAYTFSNGSLAEMSQGPSLMFVTLPKIFSTMPMGSFVGALFFLLVLFAALTSIISLMEAIISVICDHFKWNRKKATLVLAISSILIGILPSLGFGALSEFKILDLSILDQMDFLSNYVLMPLGALLTAILIGYVVGPKVIIDEVETSGTFKRKKTYVFILKYIAPIATILVLVSSILNALGIIKL